ncbi:MAG: TonB-dependent receptor [Bacteroidales bacterium]
MRNTVLILLISALQVFATGSYAQTKKISLDMNDATIREVLYAIQKQSEFYFLYNSELIDVMKKVDINIKEEKVENVLTRLFDKNEVDFLIKDRYIVLTPVGGNAELFAEQQQPAVSGTVTDETGQPLPGVTVVVKGTTQGTVTNADGNYSITNIPEDATLVFSFVGMRTQEVAVGNQTSINIEMEVDAIGIEEVVAIGYGTIKKSDLTGSVASVKSEELNTFPTSSAVQALQGRAAGVQIQSDNGGEPGGNYNILIRGSSSINASSNPLYVVDGFPEGNLPPASDILSIEILKDASATAIYGSRGANGVVMITTKKGNEGAMKIALNTSYSVQNVIKRYDLLNARQYAELINDVNLAEGVDPFFENPASYGVGTDWQDEIFQMGNIQNYNLSLKGGSDKVNYYISGEYYNQEGTVINSDYKKYSLLSNVDIKSFSDKLKIGLNFSVGRADQNRLSTQEGTTSAIGGGVVTTALWFAPTETIYADDGSYNLHPLGLPLDNPVAIANERKSQRLIDYMQTSIFGELDLHKNLKYKAIIGTGVNNSRAGNYVSSKLEYGGVMGGIATVYSNKSSNILAENYLTFTKDFNDSQSLTVMAGYSYQAFSSEGHGVTATGFITDAFTWWNLHGSTASEQPTSSLVESELSSFFGRINYVLKDRYLFTINGRYDGSSRFAANKKWAFFPSGAFAWNIHNEKFLRGSEVISQLKLRTSYGVIGNQAIAPYQSLGKLIDVFTVINGKKVNAVRPYTVTNSNLTWESTAQSDIGVNIGLFKSKLLFSADYYRKITSDLLFEVPLPLYSGYSTQLKNIGKIENKGFEFDFQVNNIVKAIKWNSKFNLSLNRNKIVKLPGGNDIIYSTAPGQFSLSSSQIMREGEPLGSFYGFIYEGVQQSGDELLEGADGIGGERFRDIVEDGVFNDKDRTIIGNPNPDFYWGWNNDITFKNFDLNIFIQGVQGNDMLNYTRMGLESVLGVYNSTKDMLDRWTPENTDTDIPKAAVRAHRLSTRWVEDASFIRLENVMLGYTFPVNVLGRIGVRSLRIYVSGQKLLTFTKYKGFDPEVSWSSGNMNAGLDYGSYPNTRNFTVGLNVGF